MSRTIRDRGHYRWMHGSDVEYINRQLDTTNRWALMRMKYDRPPYTTYYDKYIKDDETIIRESKEQLKRWTRDGRDGLTSSNANTGFKTDAKKIATEVTGGPLAIGCSCGQWRFVFAYMATAGGYGLPDHLRMTIGLEAHNRAVVEALADFMQAD